MKSTGMPDTYDGVSLKVDHDYVVGSRAEFSYLCIDVRTLFSIQVERIFAGKLGVFRVEVVKLHVGRPQIRQ